MQLNLETSSAKYQIKSYAPGNLVVNQQSYNSPVIITPNDLVPWNSEELEPIFALEPSIVLWGTGENPTTLANQIILQFTNRNIGIEVMSTAAACRTFMLLVAEQRNVLAALVV